ncbi:methyltransferase domain-containing protein [Endothiovibrio diazotrophicus]
MKRPSPRDRSADRQALVRWFAGPLGAALLAAEQARLDATLGSLSGYHAVQLGDLGEADLLRRCIAPHRVVVEPDSAGGAGRGGLLAVPERLPLAGDSVGVTLLPHTLEFCDAPHEVLREAYRVLIPEGHLVLVGFNPWGLWGARHLLRRREAPWSGRFLSPQRVKDWLALLGFRVELTEHLFYRPPINSPVLLKRMGVMERLGGRWWPPLSAVYLLVARKRVIPLTPIRPRWRARRGLVPGGLAEPTTRANREEP